MNWNTASKYNSQKSKCAYGHLHDSKKEANRCNELHLLLKTGDITDLEIQKPYELIPAQYRTEERYSAKTGKRLKDRRILLEKSCTYDADFVYRTKDGALVVEDCKGVRTKEYRIKKKLMLWVHGIHLSET